MILWFVLFHDSKRKIKARTFQLLVAVGREVLASSVMPLRGSPFRCGAGCLVTGSLSWAQEINPSDRWGRRYFVPGTAASCHSEDLHLCCGV